MKIIRQWGKSLRDWNGKSEAKSDKRQHERPVRHQDLGVLAELELRWFMRTLKPRALGHSQGDSAWEPSVLGACRASCE